MRPPHYSGYFCPRGSPGDAVADLGGGESRLFVKGGGGVDSNLGVRGGGGGGGVLAYNLHSYFPDPLGGF